MIYAIICFVLGFVAGLPVSSLAQNSSPSQDETMDYEKAVSGWNWRWDDSKVGPLACIPARKYGLRVATTETPGRLEITVTTNKADAYSWQGHRFSVFRVVDDRLYFAVWHPNSSGGKVVAVDLSTGKKLWQDELQALGPIQHSGYSNQLILEVNHNVVTVWGNESRGRYVEVKRIDTGETVGHKIFRKDGFDVEQSTEKGTRTKR